MKCELGHILTYYDGSQPQFTHLRASMLQTSSQCYKGSNQMRRSEWPPTASMSVNLCFTSSRVSKRMWLPKDVAVGRSCACSVYSRKTSSLRSPRPNDVTRARPSSCPWNMQPTSLPDCIATEKDSLPASRHATMTRCRGTA